MPGHHADLYTIIRPDWRVRVKQGACTTGASKVAHRNATVITSRPSTTRDPRQDRCCLMATPGHLQKLRFPRSCSRRT